MVAAKRMHQHYLADPEFRQMFLAESQLAARVEHPNVVPILDVVSLDDELIIVMPYVHGDALYSLLKASILRREPVPIPICCAIMVGVLHGLHAAHEARSESGKALGIVHHDVSPHNVLVGVDGIARVFDFGIAKALDAQSLTVPGTVKGKFSYMAPEVIRCAAVTRRTDLFSAGIVLWELLAGRQLFGSGSRQERLTDIVGGNYPSPRAFNQAVPRPLEMVVEKALQLDPQKRYGTALEFAAAIERVEGIASQRLVADWVNRLAQKALEERSQRIYEIESTGTDSAEHATLPPAPSMTANERVERGQPSVPTALSSPRARRADRSRVLAVAAASFLVALGLSRFLPSRNEYVTGSTFAERSASAILAAGGVPTEAASVARSSSAQEASAVHVGGSSGSHTAETRKTTNSRKSLSRRAVVSGHPRSNSADHAKPYLPSEL